MQHPTTQFFTGRMPFLLPNQQRQSTEGMYVYIMLYYCFKILTVHCLICFRVIVTVDLHVVCFKGEHAGLENG